MNTFLTAVITVLATAILTGCGHSTVRSSPREIDTADIHSTHYQILMDMAINKPDNRELYHFYHPGHAIYPRRPATAYVPSPSHRRHPEQAASLPVIHVQTPHREHKDRPDRDRRGRQHGHDKPPSPVARRPHPDKGHNPRSDREHDRPDHNRVRTPPPAYGDRKRDRHNRNARSVRREHPQFPPQANSPPRRKAAPAVADAKPPATQRLRPALKPQQAKMPHHDKHPVKAAQVNRTERRRHKDKHVLVKPANKHRNREKRKDGDDQRGHKTQRR